MKGYGAYTYRWYIIQTDSPVLTDKMVIKLDLESCRDEFDRQHSRKMLKRKNMMNILKKFIKACEFEYLDKSYGKCISSHVPGNG